MSDVLKRSSSWMWVVRKSRESKAFFVTFATICGVIPGIIGYGVMHLTSRTNPQLEAKLRLNARPDTQMMGRANKERLAEYLGELQRKEDTNDRYVAALREKHSPGNHIQPIPNPPNDNGKI